MEETWPFRAFLPLLELLESPTLCFSPAGLWASSASEPTPMLSPRLGTLPPPFPLPAGIPLGLQVLAQLSLLLENNGLR